MWSSSSSARKTITNNNNNNGGGSDNRVSQSPSKSSSTCSSPSPFSPSSSPTITRQSMEEVWKDINLASLQNHQVNNHSDISTVGKSNTNPYPGLIFQDFFSNKDPTPTPPPPPSVPVQTRAVVSSSVFTAEVSSPLGDITASFGSLVPAKATMLSLNSSSGCDFQFLENSGQVRGDNQAPHFGSCSLSSPFDSLGSPTGFHMFAKKRGHENDDNSSDDRRHKRMIKNRESAARSRARKQAYTNELERNVADLQAENAKLKRQADRLLAASAKFPEKRALYRTISAPF